MNEEIKPSISTDERLVQLLDHPDVPTLHVIDANHVIIDGRNSGTYTLRNPDSVLQEVIRVLSHYKASLTIKKLADEELYAEMTKRMGQIIGEHDGQPTEEAIEVAKKMIAAGVTNVQFNN